MPIVNSSPHAQYFNQDAPRQDVSIELNEDLLARTLQYTDDLAGTIETLLAGFIASERLRLALQTAALDAVVDALNLEHDRHGILSDEFSPL